MSEYHNSASGDSEGKFKRGKEKLRQCPDMECGLIMRASNLVRHVKMKHPHVDDGILQAALNDRLGPEDASLDGSLNLPLNVLEESSNIEEATKENKTGMINCPGCALDFRPNMITRHWKKAHPEEPMPEFAFKKNRNLMPESLECAPDMSSTVFVDCSENSEDDGTIGGDIVQCGYSGCDFASNSKTDLAKHRRNYGHPKKRDESQVDSDDEMITIEPNFEVGSEDQSGGSIMLKHTYPEEELGRLKYDCNSPGCGYRSQFRCNLDRHCKKNCHFSTLLIRTSKNPNPEMVRLASEHMQFNGFEVPYSNLEVKGDSEGIEDEGDEEPMEVAPIMEMVEDSNGKVELTDGNELPVIGNYEITGKLDYSYNDSSSLKYACDVPGCGYRTKFRGNLDRHCKVKTHFSFMLIKTSNRDKAEQMLQTAKQLQAQLQQINGVHDDSFVRDEFDEEPASEEAKGKLQEFCSVDLDGLLAEVDEESPKKKDAKVV